MKTVFCRLGALFITQIIAFLGGVLLVYWTSRVALLLRGQQGELNYLLDEDLKMARDFWHLIRSLFFQTFMVS